MSEGEYTRTPISNMHMEGRIWVRADWMELLEPGRYLQNAFNRRNA